MPVLIDHGLRLNVHRLVKSALAGHRAWGWTRDGKRIATIGYALSMQGEDQAHLRLSYQRDGLPIDDGIALIAEPCRFGGWRWFAICPATGFKVSNLYLPPGASRFRGRKTWRLAYASQQVTPGFARLCDQRDRLLTRTLKSNLPECPIRPKGMRQATFARHCARLDRLHHAMDAAFLCRFGIQME